MLFIWLFVACHSTPWFWGGGEYSKSCLSLCMPFSMPSVYPVSESYNFMKRVAPKFQKQENNVKSTVPYYILWAYDAECFNKYVLSHGTQLYVVVTLVKKGENYMWWGGRLTIKLCLAHNPAQLWTSLVRKPGWVALTPGWPRAINKQRGATRTIRKPKYTICVLYEDSMGYYVSVIEFLHCNPCSVYSSVPYLRM